MGEQNKKVRRKLQYKKIPEALVVALKLFGIMVEQSNTRINAIQTDTQKPLQRLSKNFYNRNKLTTYYNSKLTSLSRNAITWH